YFSLTSHAILVSPSSAFFFFNAPSTTALFTLSLHDALPISVPCAVRRMRDGRVLPVQQTTCALHLRRSIEARAGVSRNLAASPPPTRARGVPRRCCLSPLATPGARRTAERRNGRRLDTRSARDRT